MVTIYDMATGELIAAAGQQQVALPTAVQAQETHQAWLAPRLEPVTTAPAVSQARRLPADLADASVAAFLARQ